MKNGKLIYNGWSGITPSMVGSFIGRSLSIAESSIITNLITSLEDYIARSCDRNFLVLEANDYYVETFRADKWDYELYNYPIDLKKIILNGQVIYDKNNSVNPFNLNKDFYIMLNRIKFITLPEGLGYENDIEFQYNITSFYGEDVRQAIIRVVSDIFLNRQYAGKELSSFSFSGLNLNFVSEKTTRMLGDIISYYKKICL